MKHNLWKKSTLALALVMSASTLVACGGGSNGNKDEAIDETKTQLYVAVVPSGYGDSWLYKSAEDFEKAFAEKSFEEGKTGVQVYVSADAPGGNTAASYLSGLSTEIILTEDVDYYNLVNSNFLYDMTDAVTGDMADVGEAGQTIEGKMSEDYIDFFKKDGKYYGLPFNVNNTGIVYDADLFDDESLYFEGTSTGKTENNEMPAKKTSGKYKFTDSTGTLSAGPDGKAGTADDGLPATYEQFFALCDEMVKNRSNLVPITWPGAYQFHIYRFMYCLWAANEGYEQMRLNYEFDGTATDLVESISSDGTVTYMAETKIDSTNGYLLQKQAGRYYALSFVEQLVNNKNIYEEDLCFGKAQLQTDAQDTFLMGAFNKEQKRTAMLVEGCHWENEATDTFNRMENRYGAKAAKANRNFAFLPMPHPTEAEIGKKSVVCDAYNSAIFINGNIADNKKEVAETFVKFFHTRSQMAQFNQITSICRPYDYEMTKDEFNAMSSFGQSVYENAKAADILSPYSSNPIAIKNYGVFNPLMTGIWTSKVGGSTYTSPSDSLRNNGVSAKAYFEGLAARYDQVWWQNNA